ncbi:AraC family transcriptional regulator [Flagellimonas algicola]|uniref:Helix-turn-helix domain-containing protein n=1 Tax=Flagellimonas algicola TaxID=2583815 RepID=A0ABY2WL76_9FLAO|nr:helix-turn-helix domain-containing protein [Allomuricauda algicola]TMU55282.1 helix-turn-helix domain-containing protein [Allomuricauda algicola]
MKIQLETIAPNTKSPFRLLHLPRLNHLFYWHFHPEYELVYIEGASATRHVGDSISNFEDSDLVFIGSNIPHLNFDYGVQTEYIKEVLHIKPSFKEQLLTNIPELEPINALFEKSKYGLVFTGDTKKRIGERLKKLHLLSPFELFMESIHILKELASSSDFFLLHDYPFVNRYRKKEQARLRDLHAFVDKNYQRKIEIAEVAALCNLGKEAFCRYFKKSTGNTFTNFLNQYRISQAKRLLLIGKNVSETCYECGFESLSYFNRTFKKISGENPSDFKKQYLVNLKRKD